MGSESDSQSIEIVDPPASFRERLREYRVEPSNPLATHRWMGSRMGGTYAIPPDVFHELMQLYIDDASNGEVRLLLAELPYKTAKLHLPVVRAFCDVDFDSLSFNEICEKSGQGVAGVYQAIARCFLETLRDITQMDKVACGFRIARNSGQNNKFHIHVPDQLITTGMAKATAGRVQARLSQVFGDKVDWGKVIDSEVYTNGLRLVGSHKPSREANSSSQGHGHGQGAYVALIPADEKDWSKGFSESPISDLTVDELLDFSILPDPADKETQMLLEDMELEARLNNPDEAAATVSKTYAQPAKFLTTRRRGQTGLLQVDAGLTQADVDALIAELENIRTKPQSPFASYQLDPKKITYSQQHKALTIILNDFVCPFKKEPHRRANRNSQYLYLTINKGNRVSMRCWDQDSCANRRYPHQHSPKIASEAVLAFLKRLRGNEQVAAKTKAKEEAKKRKHTIIDQSTGYSARVAAAGKAGKRPRTRTEEPGDETELESPVTTKLRKLARPRLLSRESDDATSEEDVDMIHSQAQTDSGSEEAEPGLDDSSATLRRNFENMGISSDEEMGDAESDGEDSGPWAMQRRALRDMGAVYELTEEVEFRVQEAVTLQVNGSVASLFIAIFGEIMRPDQSRYRGSKWYSFRPDRHRWVKSDTSAFKLFTRYLGYFCEIWRNKMESECGEEVFAKDHLESWTRLVARLKDTSFQNSSLEQVCQELYEEEFIEKLDQNPDLVGFDNGVLDCSTGKFRKGKPSDCISYSCRHDLQDFADDDPKVQEVQDFFATLFVDPQEREYIINLLAKCLHGRTALGEKFFMFSAAGSNGKTKLISLVRKAFGDYAREVDVSLLTQRRAAASGPNPALIQLRGKRFITTNEPNTDDELNIGLMKTLSGGDTISARDLFKSPIEFSIIGAIFLTCNSYVAVNSSDKGTWRRLTSVKFKTTFVVGEPDPSIGHQRKADLGLDAKLPLLAPALLSILVKTFRKNRNQPLVEPPAVVDATRELQSASDPLYGFWQRLERVPDATTSAAEIWTVFNNYLQKSGCKKVDRYVLLREVRDRFGECTPGPDGQWAFDMYKLKVIEEDPEQQVQC